MVLFNQLKPYRVIGIGGFGGIFALVPADGEDTEPAAPAGTAATGDGAAVTQVRRSFFVY